jgi:hypothetical protein
VVKLWRCTETGIGVECGQSFTAGC